MRVLVYGFILSSVVAQAHVRQRSFYQYDEDDISAGGIEAILHWSESVPLRMHQFSGCLGRSSTISFDGSVGGCSGDAHTLMGDSIAQWLDPGLAGINTRFAGVVPGLTTILDAGDKPEPTTSGCEFTSDGGADGVNNIVFTTKIDTSCSSSIDIPEYDGVIGLTRVRYALTSGKIVEADIQFNDSDYTFVASGQNDLAAGVVNLKDVAVHELGHFFGLDHSSSRTSSMLFAVSDGMRDAASDDIAGLWSLYQNQSSSLGSLKGSLTISGTPVFGAVVNVLDARSLKLVAAEITNLDGAFEFCGLPEGSYIAYASPYKPAGSNIHDYYSGFGGFAATDGGTCANPGCKRMNTAIKSSWLTEETDPDFGKALKIFTVSGSSENKFLNLKGSTTEMTAASPWELTAATSNTAILELDSPRIMRFRNEYTVPVTSSSLLVGKNDFQVSSESGDLEFRVASLSIYSRVSLGLELLTEARSTPAGVTCSLTSGTVSEGKDAELSCSGLTINQNYILRVTATAVPCDDVPGNSSGCSSSVQEVASSAIPYYAITAYDPNVSDFSLSTMSLESSTLASSNYTDLPSCSSYVTSREDTSDPAACCGSLEAPGIDSGMSMWIAFVMSPLSWVLVAIGLSRLNRARRARNVGV